VSQIPLKGPVRVIKVGTTKEGMENGDSSCSLNEVRLCGGIPFNHHPPPNSLVFYAWSQLGIGSTGTCCLATVASGAVCILKFFHPRLGDSAVRASKEKSKWNHIYEEENWTFIDVYDVNGTSMLVMPYLRAPEDKAARDLLLSGEKESPLWKVLKAFADKGMKHDDLKWRHVRIGRKGNTGRNSKAGKGDIASTVEQVFLLDLGSVSDLEPIDALKWVKKSFEEMKEQNCE
jgi:hypothetical protein